MSEMFGTIKGLAVIVVMAIASGLTVYGLLSLPDIVSQPKVKVTYLKDSDLEVIVDSVFGVVCYKSNVGISCIQPDLKDAPLGDL